MTKFVWSWNGIKQTHETAEVLWPPRGWRGRCRVGLSYAGSASWFSF